MKHFNAIITVNCFLVGAPMPPELAKKWVYENARITLKFFRR